MYHLANTANVQAISKKMIEFLDQIKGDNKKKDLIDKILHLAEMYPFIMIYYSRNLIIVLVIYIIVNPLIDRLLVHICLCVL